MKFRSSCSHLTTPENFCTTRGVTGFERSQRTRSSLLLLCIALVSLSAMIPRFPVKFILLDTFESGHGITPTSFAFSWAADVDNRNALVLRILHIEVVP